MSLRSVCLMAAAWLGCCMAAADQPKPHKVEAVELVPERRVRPGHPRLFINEKPGRYATSLEEVRKLAAAKENRDLLDVVRGDGSMASGAMVWLATGEKAAATAALEKLRQWQAPGDSQSDRLAAVRQACLAYDWLFGFPDFTDADKQAVRDAVLPAAEAAAGSLFSRGAHVFHQGYYCDAAAVTYAACAFAAEDKRFEPLVEKMRTGWNDVLLPALKYLNGVPGEPLGTWTIYAMRAVGESMRLIDSALGTDVFMPLRRRFGAPLRQQIEGIVHGTRPDLRFVEWGYLAEGPNGGATLEAAVTIDALAGVCESADAAWFSRQLEKVRGAGRYYPQTAALFFACGGRPDVKGGEDPPKDLCRLFQTADGGGQAYFRTGWTEADLLVAFRCTDHFGSRNHFDQGAFLICRNGPLVIDPAANTPGEDEPQSSEMHNTLRIDGKGQRPVKGQWSPTLEHFLDNRTEGLQLATGTVEAFKALGKTNYVIGDFTAAYDGLVAKRVRRALFFLPPDGVVVVDLVETTRPVSFVLHVPQRPAIDREAATFTSSNGASGLTCRTLLPAAVTIETSEQLAGHRVTVTPAAEEGKPAASPVVLVHVLMTGPKADPPKLPECEAKMLSERLRIKVGPRTITIPVRGTLAPTVF